MLTTLFQMFALIGLGLLWSSFNPGRMDSGTIRKVLTDIVYYIFLPALVFSILWQAELGVDSLKISASAAAGVISTLVIAWLLCRKCRTHGQIAGAIILAASFPNATYLGYPLLTSTLGDWAGAVAIQYDLFACTPILLTVGILLAAHYGNSGEKPNPLLLLIKVPPLWAAIIATSLNLAGVEPITWITGLLSMMGGAVVPLMLFSVGLALKQGFKEIRYLPTIVPVILLQLFIMPLVVLATAILLNIDGQLRTAVILEAAMPSMALGVVLCDRYGLNTGIYAASVTVTTLLSLFTLPLWYSWIV